MVEHVTPSVVEANDSPVVTQKANWFNLEPVALMYVIQTGIALAMGFGLPVDTVQMALILTFTGAVLTLITRQQVTPFIPTGVTPNATPNQTPLSARETVTK